MQTSLSGSTRAGRPQRTAVAWGSGTRGILGSARHFGRLGGFDL